MDEPTTWGFPRARARTPRPWAASLQRPAAKILVAGGLTLAGWLLSAALSGSTAGAAEQATCPQAPATSTVDHAAKPSAHSGHGEHRKSHRETAAATCAQQPETGEAQQPDETPVAEPSTGTEPEQAPATQLESQQPEKQQAEDPAAGTQPTSEEPAAETHATTEEPTTEAPTTNEPTTPKATANAGLLGGLVGGVLNVVGGTLTTVTNTVTVTLTTVTNTLSHTVLAPLTQPPANNPDAPVLLPLDDVLGPVFSGGSNSGGVTATVPTTTTLVATEAPVTVVESVPAAVAVTQAETAGRGGGVHFVVRHVLPRQQAAQRDQQPRDSGVHARDGGGGDTTPGLPGGTTAPSAPAPSAAPGHDGPGGARHPSAVHSDDVTTTQLKLIGTSRDHEVDGAGREAALPTTSPD